MTNLKTAKLLGEFPAVTITPTLDLPTRQRGQEDMLRCPKSSGSQCCPSNRSLIGCGFGLTLDRKNIRCEFMTPMLRCKKWRTLYKVN
jgi:hypothetical protein